MVFMDEEDLMLAERLAAIELARLSGTKDYTLEEFRKNMHEAIDQSGIIISYQII